MKTMPVVFFAMLFFAGLAIGQTVTETNESTEQQPSWCQPQCISMPVRVQGEGAMQVVEDASRRDAVDINNFNFTKMRNLQGDEFSVNTVIHVGDVWFMTVEDAFSTPDWSKVKQILQAEQKRINNSSVSVNTLPNPAPTSGLNNSKPAATSGATTQPRRQATPPSPNPASPPKARPNSRLTMGQTLPRQTRLTESLLWLTAATNVWPQFASSILRPSMDWAQVKAVHLKALKTTPHLFTR